MTPPSSQETSVGIKGRWMSAAGHHTVLRKMRWSIIFFLILCSMMMIGLGFQLWYELVQPSLLSQRILASTTRPAKKIRMCKPVHNFVFVKTHKTGSTSLKSVTTRFGYARNLSFILQEDTTTGHFNYVSIIARGNKTNILPPIGVVHGDYDNYKGYNICNVHVRYKPSLYRQLMHPKTFYISIVREPSSQWLSAFQYFRIYEVLETDFANLTDAVAEFMKMPHEYQKKNTFAWNNQLLDLGLDRKHFTDEMKIMEHLTLLEKNLDLVLITEYFDESLLLLRKLFCWSLDDILYLRQREQGSHITVNDTLRRKILAFNRGDTLLYKTFNKTFWKKVSQYGPSFHDDLNIFRNRLKDVEKKCIGERVVKPAEDGRVYRQYKRKPGADGALCDTLINDNFELEKLVMERQGKNSCDLRSSKKLRKSGISNLKDTLTNQTLANYSLSHFQSAVIN